MTRKTSISIMLPCLYLWLLLYSDIIVAQTIIKTIPGFNGDLPFTLETGYISVGEMDEVQLFYYFVESQRSPADDPLLLWLTGGPGCSGFSGLVYEIGPLMFNYLESKRSKTTVLELNPYSWTKVANIIFIDAPVGTGFSFALSSEAYNASDTTQAIDNYKFLRKWLLAHPKFLKNLLYIAGDSYSGKIVPMLVQKIAHGIEVGLHPVMNLQGYILGNPLTDYVKDIDSRLEFAYLKGLISKKLYESATRNCKGQYIEDPSTAACEKDIQLFSVCTDKLDLAQILEPDCNLLSKDTQLQWNQISLTEDFTDDFLTSRVLFSGPWCRGYNYVYSYIYLNNKSVQKALHIREGTIDKWVRCNKTLSYTEDLQSSLEIHRDLIKKGYRVLIYSGDHDMAIPYVGTFAWIKSLNLSIDYDWAAWFVEGQVAGYTIQYYQLPTYYLTLATVKGAGHTAPEYKPKECFAMIDRWLAYFYL